MQKPAQLQNLVKKMTAKQIKFCEEYVKDFNATRAALAAGYASRTAHSIGCDNLTKTEIREYLAHIQGERFEECRIEVSQILTRTYELANSNIVPILEAARNDELKDLPLSVQKTIKSIRYKKRITPDRHGNTEEDESWMITMHDVNKPLELLWKHLGLLLQDSEAIAALQTYGKVTKTSEGFTFEYADKGDEGEGDEG